MPNGHPYIPRRMTALKRMRWLRKRVQRWAFNSGGGRIVIRWHGGTLAELENYWRLRGKRHHAFVPGGFMRPELRMRHLVNSIKAKAS